MYPNDHYQIVNRILQNVTQEEQIYILKEYFKSCITHNFVITSTLLDYYVQSSVSMLQSNDDDERYRGMVERLAKAEEAVQNLQRRFDEVLGRTG